MTESILLLADAHVHVHPAHRGEATLSAAHANLARARDRLRGAAARALGYLLLAERVDTDFFAAALRGEGGVGGWSVRRTDEEASAVAEDAEGRHLVLVAGAQIATRDGLEVLALGTRHRPPDGQPFAEALAAAVQAAPLVVVPWGVGKWTGRRGRLVREALLGAGPRQAGLFVGDNGGRPAGSPRPRLVRVAEQRGVRVLPGSDPLPIAGEEGRVGTAGFAVAGRVDLDAPLHALLEAMAAAARLRTFLRGVSLPRFLANQLRMQTRKWFGGA